MAKKWVSEALYAHVEDLFFILFILPIAQHAPWQTPIPLSPLSYKRLNNDENTKTT